MTDKKGWHTDSLRAWVIRTQGKDQWRLANECLQSVFERHEIAKYHHDEARRLLYDPIAKLDHFERLAWALGAEVAGMEETFGPVRLKVAAHSLATVQSMHAVIDTLAQVLRYVFALPSENANYVPSAKQVKKRLPDGRIKQLLGDLLDPDDAKYLAALCNHSKHHSIVGVAYSIPLDEGDKEGLQWRAFTNEGTPYPSRPVRDTLVSEFQRQQDVLFAIYSELDVLASAPTAS